MKHAQVSIVATAVADEAATDDIVVCLHIVVRRPNLLLRSVRVKAASENSISCGRPPDCAAWSPRVDWDHLLI